MSKSGMTRRMDELGRLVIPKEIRDNLKIKNNDPIEISIINDKIVLSKYDYLKKDDIIHLILSCMKRLLKKNILFTSRDKIIDYCLITKEEVDNIELNTKTINIIENRKEIINNKEKTCLFSEINTSSYIISPLIIKGDLYGSLIIYSDNNIQDDDIAIFHFVKTFLENYLE